MIISLKKISNRFGFDVLEDSGKIVCSSNQHSFLIPYLSPTYKYAWEACRDAWKLAYKGEHHIKTLRFAKYDMEEPSKLNVSAEDRLIDYYTSMYKNLSLEAQGDEKDPKERKNTYEMAKAIIKEIKGLVDKIEDPNDKKEISKIPLLYKKLIHKYFPKEEREDAKKEENPAPSAPANLPSLPPPDLSGLKMASRTAQNNNDSEFIGSLLDTYAEKISESIQNKHDAYYSINPNLKEITILDFSNEPLLKIKINDSFNITSIIPVGKLQRMYPVQSASFYQKYWKPIVESIGHISVGSDPIIIVTPEGGLPDVTPNDASFNIEGWNINSKKPENVNISFKGENTWMLSKDTNTNKTQVAPSQYTEQDYLNAIVKCTDKNLKSIYGRTGSVMQVIPHSDFIEVDVNFGRGLDVVRLIEKQIEIVPV